MKKSAFPYLNRIILISAFLLVPGILVINLIHYRSNELVFRRGLSDTTLPVIADSIAVTMDDINTNYALISRLFAASFNRTLLSESGEDAERIQEYLRTWSGILDVKNIGVVSLKSGHYYDLEQNLTLDFSSPRDAWVPEFLASDSDYNYSLYDPDDDYAPLYSFFHDFKIRDLEGRVIGIAGLGLSYNKFHDRVKGLHEGLYVSFLDREGRFRLPLEDRGKDLESLYGLTVDYGAIADMREDLTAWVPGHDDGDKSLLLLRFLPEINRYLLIELDVTEVLKDFRRQNNRTLLSLALFSLLVVTISLIYSYLHNRSMAKRVYQDNLTGCHNREFLSHCLPDITRFDSSSDSPVVMVFDIDYFKKTNDSQGHKAGDRVLKKVSDVVRRHLRTPDVMIRWGGDEFVILLNADSGGALHIAERIRASVEEETGVTISMGITRLTASESFSQAFARADKALYEAKAAGRNRIYSRGFSD